MARIGESLQGPAPGSVLAGSAFAYALPLVLAHNAERARIAAARLARAAWRSPAVWAGLVAAAGSGVIVALGPLGTDTAAQSAWGLGEPAPREGGRWYEWIWLP